MQNAKFPMEILRVTQGYGYSVDGVGAYSYSHSKTYALDLGGRDGNKDWLYAPFDCVVKRIYGNYNAVWFESTDKVMCADGIARILVMMCIHMNNSDKNSLGLYVGKRLAQGARCYREGTAGNASGNHVHMEIGQGPFTGTGWHAVGSQWVINNKLIPSKVLFVGQDVIMRNPVYKWTIESKNSEPSAPSTGTFATVSGKEIEVRAQNVEYFNTTSVDKPLGKLEYGKRYPMTAKSTSKINGWEWAKFKMNNTEYYTAIVNDNRFSIVDANGDGNNNISSGYSAGQKVFVSGTLFASSKATSGTYKQGNYYWIYDGKVENGRMRVTNSKTNVGKTPVGTYVSGWVSLTAMRKA